MRHRSSYPCLLPLVGLVCTSSIRVSEPAGSYGSPNAYLQLGELSQDHIELVEIPADGFAEKLWHKVLQIPQQWSHGSAMPFFLGIGMLAIFMCAIVDFRTGYRADPQSDSHGRAISGSRPQTPPERSVFVIWLLTSYRFYTGFLGATWVPFLIAEEGKNLIPQAHILSTASFMGMAKMIYGFSIFLNPFFGLLSDRLASSAPWGGRSAFLLAGIGLSGIGIYAASLASDSANISWYLGSSCLWMLGEAMADITSETVAPEMLPPSQYDLASSIRTIQHILGCMCAYIAIMVAALYEWHWRWLYLAYLALMLLCALPTVACMRSLQDGSSAPRAGRSHSGPILASIREAYIAPTRYAGGFPRACLCISVFCLGTGPLFFTLLMLHDLVGLESHTKQQYHFSAISITFLIGACITAVWSGRAQAAEAANNSRRHRRSQEDAEASSHSSSDEEGHGRTASTSRASEGDAGAGPSAVSRDRPQEAPNRWTLMFLSMFCFGVVCCIMPCVSFLPASQQRRLICFYVVSFFLGLTFGSVYSRMQACTWSLLPANVDIANAMGFAAVAKLVGVGIGNMVAGLILDAFRTTIDVNGQNYSFVGYLVMNWSSAACVFVSAALVLTISRKRQHLLKFLK